MSKTSYICNCDVIHEDIVNDVKSKMQPKDDYIQLASLFKLFGDGTRVQILHALEPVSYTHLDVYKRQSFIWRLNNKFSCNRFNQSICCFQACFT